MSSCQNRHAISCQIQYYNNTGDISGTVTMAYSCFSEGNNHTSFVDLSSAYNHPS